jgi:hypothetical protein
MGRIGKKSDKKGVRIAVLAAVIVVLLCSCDPMELKNYITTRTFGTIYVSDTTGSDSNPGTMAEPMKSIDAAIDYLKQNSVTGRVNVAVGTYNYEYSAGDFIQVVEGISLYGGFSLDFSNRDVDLHETIIADNSSSGGIFTDPNRPVDVPTGVTSTTTVDGFTIKGGGGGYTSALFCTSSSPTISNNKIYGGNADTESIGIFNLDAETLIINNREIHGGTVPGSGWVCMAVYNYSGANPTIENNYIFGGTGPRTAGIVSQSGTAPTINANTIHGGDGTIQGDGIQDNGSSAKIWNNVISGGSNGGLSSGIACFYACNAEIYNNTINGGGATTPHGLYLSDGGGSATPTPSIRNNIIFTSGGGYCIYETHTDTENPQEIERNSFWDNGGSIILYRRIAGGPATDYDSAIAINGLSWASNNTDLIPLFQDFDGIDNNLDTMIDNDWHLAAGTPSSILTGGMDLVLIFKYDRDGKLRTGTGSTGWSMGAYEY